jgi:hypothetical protein
MGKRTQTRWRRFAAAAVPAAAVATGLMIGIANGAVPVAMSVSGETFKVAAAELDGTGFEQYSSMVTAADGETIPVAASEIGYAELTDLCQSVSLPKGLQAIIGDVTLMITAGDGGTPVTANNLTIGLQELRGDAVFENITIGTDGSTLGSDKSGHDLIKGTVGQQAETVNIKNLEQTAYSTHAGTFTLTNLKLRVDTGGSECFDWG